MCLFDKTGTLTSDKLRAETMISPDPLGVDMPPVAIALSGVAKGQEGQGGREGDEARPGLAAEVCYATL